MPARWVGAAKRRLTHPTNSTDTVVGGFSRRWNGTSARGLRTASLLLLLLLHPLEPLLDPVRVLELQLLLGQLEDLRRLAALPAALHDRPLDGPELVLLVRLLRLELALRRLGRRVLVGEDAGEGHLPALLVGDLERDALGHAGVRLDQLPGPDDLLLDRLALLLGRCG